MRVLVVEDSKRLRERGFREMGYAVDEVADGRSGVIHARTSDYDFVVLEIMLPEVDGLAVLRDLRRRDIPSSVLLLTAKETIEERVLGLGAGADDCLVKPFAFDELVARVQALARRRHSRPNPVVGVDDLEINIGKRQVRRAGHPIELTAREYALLEYLAHRVGVLVSRPELEAERA